MTRKTTVLAILIAASIPVTATAQVAKLDRLVTFDPGQTRVHSKNRTELKQVARVVKATCPAATITVEGNAYIESDEEASITLGQTRADKVRDLLIKNGMDPKSVKAVGFARSTLEEGNGRHVDLIVDCPASLPSGN